MTFWFLDDSDPPSCPADQFPSLQSKMRVVLRVEVEAVKFLKEEPQRLDALLKRCNTVTDALSTLRRYQALLFAHIRFLNSVFIQFSSVFINNNNDVIMYRHKEYLTNLTRIQMVNMKIMFLKRGNLLLVTPCCDWPWRF